MTTADAHLNLILDIDGTLVSEEPLDLDTVGLSSMFATMQHAKKIKPRPHLETFIKEAFQICKHVSIWTAAGDEWFKLNYASHIKPILDENKLELDFIFTGDRCTIDHGSNPEMAHLFPVKRKLLKKIWRRKTQKHKYTKHNTVIVDDSPSTYMKNFGNAIPIENFTGDPRDTQLLKVLDLLKTLKKEINETGTIRYIDKRFY